MTTAHRYGTPQSYWLVGATYDGTEDQTSRFLEEGIWENGYDDKYLDLVRSMRPGERIAIKSTYYRRNGVPFDNGGAPVSVMAIKVTGTIRENPGDGKRVLVDWTRPERPRREWYFSTYLQTVHRLSAGEDWKKDGLIEFAFEDKPQDIGRFLGEPRWHEQYGSDTGDRRFRWTEFYRAVADRLLDFQGDRGPLVEGLHQIAARTNLTYLEDRFADGSRDPLRDICPFTAMGMFNRSMTIANRRVIAEEIANFLGVEVPVPESMEGIPTLNNQRSWFFLLREIVATEILTLSGTCLRRRAVSWIRICLRGVQSSPWHTTLLCKFGVWAGTCR